MDSKDKIKNQEGSIDIKVALKYLLVLLIVITVLCAVLFKNSGLFKDDKDQNTEVGIELSSNNLPEPKFFSSNIKNTSFTIPAGWEEVQLSTVALPLGAENVWYIITQPETGCMIASGDFSYQNPGYENDESNLPVYRHISFADRIYSDKDQYDGRWLVLASKSSESDVPDPFTDVRKYLSGEIRDSRSFFLWQRDGNFVPDSCNEALNFLLRTIDYYYEPITLTENSKGEVWGMTHLDNVGSHEAIKILLFTQPSGETYKILDLPSGVSYSGLVLDNRKIIFTVNNYENEQLKSLIITLDPISKSIETLLDLELGGGYISSTFLLKDNIFYLQGDKEYAWCLDRYGECKADLYSLNVYGGEPILIQKDVLGGSIMGFSPEENSLYLSRGKGDAGWVHRKINRYDFNLGVEIFVFEGGGMEGEPGLKEMVDTVNKIQGKLKIYQKTESAYLNSGKLLPSDFETDSSHSFYFVEE